MQTESHEDVAGKARWKALFQDLDQILRDQRYGDEQLQQLFEALTSLFKKAYQILEHCAFESTGNAGLRSLRSNDAEITKIIKVKSEHAQEFVNFLAELKGGVSQYLWGDIERPNIFIDLSAVHVDGPLAIHLKDNYLVTALTEFSSPLRIAIDGDANIHFGSTQFRGKLAVTWLAAGKLTLTDHGSTYYDQVVIDGSKVQINTKNESRKCLLDWININPNTMQGDLNIEGCTVEQMKFDRWTFGGKLGVTNTEFLGVEMLSCNFQGSVAFFSCQFTEKPALFLNSTFSKSLTFAESDFEKAPDFHGVKFHPNTRFRGCSFAAAGSLFGSVCTPADVASYRVLKGHFSQQKDSRQEIVFYALEQRAERAGKASDPVETALSWFQDAVCGYGQSLSRAVFVFFLWNMCFGVVFQILPDDFLSVKSDAAIADYPGVALSLQNAFNPLALFSDKGLVELQSLWMYSASLIQALGSIGIVALIILTIRGKFRKGSSSEG